MSAITQLKIQTAAFVGLAIWNFATPIFSHGNWTPVLSPDVRGVLLLAMNNWKTIRRDEEREKASGWD